MFGLFSKKQNNECPKDPEMRLWMEKILQLAVSLDGFIEGPNGEFD